MDNILLDKDLGVKICDFGVSRLMLKGQFIKEQCGTPAYVSPEMIKEQGYVGFQSDIWSLGILLYVMVSGTFPFIADTLVDLNNKILEGDIVFYDHTSRESMDLIT